MIRHDRISEKAMAELRAGRMIEAIKIVRAETGLGLAEAKQLVEYVDRGGGSMPEDSYQPQFESVTEVEMPVATLVALRNGNLIEAIRTLREKSGLGLMESKEAVEAHLADNPLLQRQFEEAAAARRKIPPMFIGIGIVVVVLAVWLGMRA